MNDKESEQPGKPEKNQTRSNHEEGGAKQNITPVIRPETSAIPEPPPSPSESYAPNNKHRWTNDPPMFWVTLAGVIVVFIYTSVAAWQAWLTRDQVRITRQQLIEMQSSSKQTDDLISAAAKSADAAKKQADIAENGARAWIAPIRFSFIDLKNPEDPLKARVFYQNVGREPARNVRNWLGAGYLRQPSLPFWQWPDLPNWKNENIFRPTEICSHVTDNKTSVVYPSPNVAVTLDVMKSGDQGVPLPELFAEVKEQRTMHFVLGCIAYDTMNETRHSTFCAYLNPIPGKDILEWQFSACPVGNDDY